MSQEKQRGMWKNMRGSLAKGLKSIALIGKVQDTTMLPIIFLNFYGQRKDDEFTSINK